MELKVLDKIDLSKIESNKPKPSPKKEEKPKTRGLQNLRKRNFQSQK